MSSGMVRMQGPRPDELRSGGVLFSQRELLGHGSYYATFYWFVWRYRGTHGTMYLSSTPVSAVVESMSDSLLEFEVYWRESSPDEYLGVTNAIHLGLVKTVFHEIISRTRFECMAHFLDTLKLPWFDGICGYSMNHKSHLDDERRELCALDLYVRSPITRRSMGDWYAHWIVLDSVAPRSWYSGRLVYYTGSRSLGMVPDGPQSIRSAM